MSVVAIIPARYGSTRLPGKPLAAIGDKPMIQHVYENAVKARCLDRVVVATDDRRIEDAVRCFGGEVMMTSKRHTSGTERAAEAARKLNAELVVNIQGDLPFIHAHTITGAVRPMLRRPELLMATACTPIENERERLDPNVVKVLTDRSGNALYFSRAPIPYFRNQGIDLHGADLRPRDGSPLLGQRHLGLYVYRRDFLFKFARLRPTALERIESLEQLRALVYGFKIFVAQVKEESVEVDTRDDLARAERYLKQIGH